MGDARGDRWVERALWRSACGEGGGQHHRCACAKEEAQHAKPDAAPFTPGTFAMLAHLSRVGMAHPPPCRSRALRQPTEDKEHARHDKEDNATKRPQKLIELPAYRVTPFPCADQNHYERAQDTRKYGAQRRGFDFSHLRARRPVKGRPTCPAHRPSPIAHRPSSIAHRPSSIGHRPSPIGHRPSVIAHRSSHVYFVVFAARAWATMSLTSCISVGTWYGMPSLIVHSMPPPWTIPARGSPGTMSPE